MKGKNIMIKTEKKLTRKNSRISLGKTFISAMLALILCTGLASCKEETSGSMENANSSTSEVVSGVVSENASNENSVSDSASKEETSDSHNHDSNVDFVLDLKAVPSETEKGVINAVITLSHVHTELIAVQFQLTFSSNTVQGIYTTNDDMVKTMTVVPMYKTTAGIEAPRYEQICNFDKSKSMYSCMYVDLLQYPLAEEGQKFSGMKNEGELVITIPFKVNDDASVGNVVAFNFMEGSITGTSNAFTGTKGSGNNATYTLTVNDLAK